MQEFKSNSVSKYSPYHILDGEAYWYQHAPPAAQKHIPALISCKIQVRRSFKSELVCGSVTPALPAA